MMTRISKYIIFALFGSLMMCQDYSLLDIFWEPQKPKIGDEVTIYLDTSDSEYFKYSYQMNIHLSFNDKDYSTYSMNRDYSKGFSNWNYTYIISQDTYFQIDNNSKFDYIDTQIILTDKDSYDNDIFSEVNLLLIDKDYQACMLILKDIINDNKGQLNAAKAEYMIAEIFLNDFEEYVLAANYYNDIISNYPMSYHEVKKSMFTLAYIYANYLNYYSDAILLYKNFKKNYPDDDLINSIDYELENLSQFEK